MFRSQKWAVSFYWNAEYVRVREERKLEKVSGGMTMNNLEWLSRGERQSQDSLAHLEMYMGRGIYSHVQGIHI